MRFPSGKLNLTQYDWIKSIGPRVCDGIGCAWLSSHKVAQLVWGRHVLRRILIVLIAGSLTHCSRSGYLEWEYIIPDDYHGYLAIRWDCSGGVPLNSKDRTVRIEFKPDGTFCTSDSFFTSWTTGDRAWSASGRPIPIYPRGRGYQGYGLCCGSTRVIGGDTYVNPGPDIILSLMWVGEMERVDASHPNMPDDEKAFLEQRFDLPYGNVPKP
jgi:hypothetical protein